jgi:hypothetical protein
VPLLLPAHGLQAVFFKPLFGAALGFSLLVMFAPQQPFWLAPQHEEAAQQLLPAQGLAVLVSAMGLAFATASSAGAAFSFCDCIAVGAFASLF